MNSETVALRSSRSAALKRAAFDETHGRREVFRLPTRFLLRNPRLASRRKALFEALAERGLGKFDLGR